ncbi:hypothetical protein T11_16152 [Trichinella zimbabwensis]|uniref:Uncharacterized protein n=1 Tax=Trichinella zimbabwensis TaxID=268475 RepID=A0A0V1H0V4_9BILA|nr:hypothetical protein T11_16152 [Trichinella zimbabwensis]
MVQLTRLCEGQKYPPVSQWQGVKLCERLLVQFSCSQLKLSHQNNPYPKSPSLVEELQFYLIMAILGIQ